MYKITNNYHTHTSRCGHAIGEDEEYVLAAIKSGIKILGFTDHVPWPDIIHPGMRMHVDLLDDYVNSITALKEKYKDQIEIHIGFEAEYLKEYVPFYTWMMNHKGIEYYILGQHCSYDDSRGVYFYTKEKNSRGMADLYFDQLEKGMRSGLFTYVAHPDIILEGYQIEDEYIYNQIRQICQIALELDIPFELNLGRARNAYYDGHEHNGNKHYPFDKFWKIAGEMHVPVVVGIDAHNPKDFIVDLSPLIERFKNAYNLNIIDIIKFKN